MQGQHSHGVAYYRCRYPSEYAIANQVDHPKNAILREDLLVGPLDQWLASVFAPDRRDQTIAMLATQLAGPDRVAQTKQASARQIAAEFDQKIASYRRALDEGASPTVVTAWIADAEGERDRELARFAAADNRRAPAAMTADEISALLAELGDIAAVLDEAPPELKGDLYRSLGLRLAYDDQTKTVSAMIDLGEHRWDFDGVRGATRTKTQPGPTLSASIPLL